MNTVRNVISHTNGTNTVRVPQAYTVNRVYVRVSLLLIALLLSHWLSRPVTLEIERHGHSFIPRVASLLSEGNTSREIRESERSCTDCETTFSARRSETFKASATPDGVRPKV